MGSEKGVLFYLKPGTGYPTTGHIMKTESFKPVEIIVKPIFLSRAFGGMLLVGSGRIQTEKGSDRLLHIQI